MKNFGLFSVPRAKKFDDHCDKAKRHKFAN